MILAVVHVRALVEEGNTFCRQGSSLEAEASVHDAEFPEMRYLPMTCQLRRDPCYQGKAFVLQVQSRGSAAQPAFRRDVRHLHQELPDCRVANTRKSGESADSLHAFPLHPEKGIA